MSYAERPDLPLDFDPDRPIGWVPEWHPDVIVRPWGQTEPGGYQRAAGVFDPDGQHIPASHCWRYAGGPFTHIPDHDNAPPVEDLPGRWMFGGMLYAHFGHFLVESTSRLWALDTASPIDGVLFFPKQRLGHEMKAFRQFADFFALIGLGEVRLRAPQHPVRVAAMTFPEPGFGIGEMSAGRPEYRAFMRARLTRSVPPEGAPDIYISRSGLNTKRGTVLLESRVDDLMSAAGYRVFHPQAHSIAEQVAQYRVARRIVALDGSALHLAAMVMSPEAKVAIINRGPSMNIADYVRQFRAFSGIDPVQVEAIKGCWFPDGQRFVKREAQGHLDFPTLGAALAEAGFIRSATGWSDPPEAEMAARLAQLSESYGRPLSYRDLRP